MSLSIDKYFSPFNNNPFGLDDFYTSPFGAFRSGPNFSLFGQHLDHLEEQEHFHPFEMKLRNGSLHSERGFYDHFDSIFHDRSRRYDLRAAASDSSRGTQLSSTGKYIIPIKIETSRKGENQASKAPGAGSTSSTASKDSRVIEFPIQVVKECPNENGKTRLTSLRDKSRSPILTHSRPTPVFYLLTPTTDENRSSKRDSSGDVVLNSDNFFAKPQSDPKLRSANSVSDVEVVELDDDDSYIGGSLRRKPLRHFQKTSAVSSRDSVTANHSLLRAENYKKSTSPKDDVVREGEIVIVGIGSRKETGNKRSSLCSHPGPVEVTAPPSYPIYDYLKPKLSSQSREIDYIRGDGNCFFRAISKDVYGSEDFHAECRQAVCDLIQGHPEVFRQYIDHSTVEAHVTDMRLPATWATTCEIYASATLLDRDVYILAPSPASSAHYNWLLFSPRTLAGSGVGASLGSSASQQQREEGGGACYMTLCHTNANHYDRITSVSGGCNCRLAPPSLNGVSIALDLTSSSSDVDSDRNSLSDLQDDPRMK